MGYAAFSLAGGLIAHRLHKILYHFRVVEPGRLYRSGTLGPVGLRVIDRVFGVNTIINLRHPNEYNSGTWFRRQSAYCKRRGIRQVLVPMAQDTPPEPAQVETVLALLADPGNRCLVHCQMGVIRTGMMVVAVIRQRYGLGGPALHRHFPLFGHRLGARRARVSAFLRECARQGDDDGREVILQSLRSGLSSGR